MLWCCTRSPVDAKSTPPPTMIHEPAGGKPCDTAALSAPHCWKPCNQNHRHKRKRSLLGTAENSAFNEETLRPCRWSNVPPDLRLTTDPRPRLHTPEAVRRANAARLIASAIAGLRRRSGTQNTTSGNHGLTPSPLGRSGGVDIGSGHGNHAHAVW